MIATRILITSFISLALAVTPAVSGQIDPERGLDEARKLYRQGLFDETIVKLSEVITELERLRDLEEKRIELADAHFLLGMSYIAIRDEVSAKENFERTAAFDPERVLDPDVHAPKVVALYEQAWRDAQRRLESPPPVEPEPPPDETNHYASGTRVRANNALVGSLVAVDDDYLTIVTEELRTVTLRRHEITTLEISTGRKGHALWGAVIGAGAGALIGLAEGGDDCLGDGCYTHGENIAYGALGAGMIGALVGALYRTDQWLTVPSTDIAVGVHVSPRGAGVSMTWSF